MFLTAFTSFFKFDYISRISNFLIFSFLIFLKSANFVNAAQESGGDHQSLGWRRLQKPNIRYCLALHCNRTLHILIFTLYILFYYFSLSTYVLIFALYILILTPMLLEYILVYHIFAYSSHTHDTNCANETCSPTFFQKAAQTRTIGPDPDSANRPNNTVCNNVLL